MLKPFSLPDLRTYSMHQADNIPTNSVPFEIYALGQRSVASSSGRRHKAGVIISITLFTIGISSPIQIRMLQAQLPF